MYILKTGGLDLWMQEAAFASLQKKHFVWMVDKRISAKKNCTLRSQRKSTSILVKKKFLFQHVLTFFFTLPWPSRAGILSIRLMAFHSAKRESYDLTNGFVWRFLASYLFLDFQGLKIWQHKELMHLDIVKSVSFLLI